VSRWRSIWLVARREVLERVRSRGFIASMAFTLVVVGGSVALTTLSSEGQSTLQLGIVRPAPTGLEPALQAAATRYALTLETSSYPDRSAGETAVEDGSVAALLVVPADLSGPGEIVSKRVPDTRALAVANAAVVGLRQAAMLHSSGVDLSTYADASAPPTPVSLQSTSSEQTDAMILAYGATLLLFYAIITYGQWVLAGIIEEKQSRVVEVVLSTVRPTDLLAGKIVGIGALGLAQLALLTGLGAALALRTGALTLPATTPSMLVLVLMWFVLGYLLYATVFAALGSLASRQEEAQNASMPVILVAVASLLATMFFVLRSPNAVAATVLTFLPPSAPIVIPIRAALGAIEPWEIALSAVITIVTIVIVLGAGARVYSGAVLQVGSRMRLGDAWRASGH
jgi:ABC-2 type transport system permease protein